MDNLVGYQVHLQQNENSVNCKNANLSLIIELRVPATEYLYFISNGIVQNRDVCLIHDKSATIQLNHRQAILAYPTLAVKTLANNCTNVNSFLCQNRLTRVNKCVEPKGLIKIYNGNIFIYKEIHIVFDCTNFGRHYLAYNQSLVFRPNHNCKYELHFKNKKEIFVIEKIHTQIMIDFTLEVHIKNEFQLYKIDQIDLEPKTDLYVQMDWQTWGSNITTFLNTVTLWIFGAFIYKLWKKRATRSYRFNQNREKVRSTLL